MTNKELIELLKKLPPNVDVVVAKEGDIESFEVIHAHQEMEGGAVYIEFRE